MWSIPARALLLRTKVETDIDREQVRTLTTVRNNSGAEEQFLVRQHVREWRSGAWVTEVAEQSLVLAAGEAATVTQDLPLSEATLWTPETPFLYVAQTTLLQGDTPTDDPCHPFRHAQGGVEVWRKQGLLSQQQTVLPAGHQYSPASLFRRPAAKPAALGRDLGARTPVGSYEGLSLEFLPFSRGTGAPTSGMTWPTKSAW